MTGCGRERGNPEQTRAIPEPGTLNIAWQLSPLLCPSLIPLGMRALGTRQPSYLQRRVVWFRNLQAPAIPQVNACRRWALRPGSDFMRTWFRDLRDHWCLAKVLGVHELGRIPFWPTLDHGEQTHSLWDLETQFLWALLTGLGKFSGLSFLICKMEGTLIIVCVCHTELMIKWNNSRKMASIESERLNKW